MGELVRYSGMTDSWSWAKRLFNEEDLYDLADRTDRIIHDNENGFIVNIGLTNEQCMDLVEHWYNSQSEDTDEYFIESFDYIEDFLANFIYFLQDYLEREHQGWEERRYGIEE
jgi:sugar-specific transcriptional regulator TrmB